MALLLVVALILAWPTFGLSLIAWFLLAYLKAQGGAGAVATKATWALSADRIAQKAASPEAFREGVATAFSTPEAIEAFFRRYGTTEKKFELSTQPRLYAGYVQVSPQPEFLAVVVPHEKGSYVTSFTPDFVHGDDFLGLLGKKIFVDSVIEKFREAHRMPTI